MFGIFPNLSKYFHAKIYPMGYGNRNRSKTEYDETTENENETYKTYLQSEFSHKQKVKRKEKPHMLRIRGESF
jgi:hypothetical protein